VPTPCFDETDDGVPPFCRSHKCPLDHRNVITNDSFAMRRFAAIGREFFDSNRKLFMGVATILTLGAFALTSFGIFGLSTDATDVKNARWARATTSFIENEEMLNVDIYIGLRSMVIGVCRENPSCSCKRDAWSTCIRCQTPQFCNETNILWGSSTCNATNIFCGSCEKAATESQMSAVVTWFTLFFAGIGSMNRMKNASDCPIQKLLGSVLDTWGFICLMFSLGTFSSACYRNLPIYYNGAKLQYYLGYGFWSYMGCAAIAISRAILHWLTPCPKKWRHLQLPQDYFERNKDLGPARTCSAVCWVLGETKPPLIQHSGEENMEDFIFPLYGCDLDSWGCRHQGTLCKGVCETGCCSPVLVCQPSCIGGQNKGAKRCHQQLRKVNCSDMGDADTMLVLQTNSTESHTPTTNMLKPKQLPPLN